MASFKILAGRVKSAARRVLRLSLVAAAALYVLYLLGNAAVSYDYGKHTLRLIDWLRKDLGVRTGCVVLATATAIATPLFVTTTPLNIGAGAVYGVMRGSFVSLAGTTAGALFCFVATRFGPGREWARAKIAASKTLTALDAVSANGGAGIVMLSRISPMFPFAAVSFAFGATRVSLVDFVTGTVVGLTPGTLMTSYIGWQMYDVTKKGQEPGTSETMWAVHRLVFVVVLTVVSGAGLGARVNQIIKKQAATLSVFGGSGPGIIGGGASQLGGLGGIGGLSGGKRGGSFGKAKETNKLGILTGFR
jgi:uncharacterized membrane protein YdjX (TVP38/TMEM64 family)